MAKVSTTIQHDYMRFILNFGPVKITGNFNRYDHTIKMAPFNGSIARAVSETLDYVMKMHVKTGGINPGQLFEVIKPAGERAKTPEEFIEFFKSDIEKVHGIVVRPFDVETKEQSTARVVKDGRGWRLEANFTNGDFLSLKSSGKSISLSMAPPITGLMDEITSLTFGYINLGAGAQELLEAYREQSEQSASVEELIDNCRASITPAAVMKR